MSAPDTNISTQERRHRGPLTGMALGIGLVAIMALATLAWVVSNGNTPGEDGAAVQTITVEPAPMVPALPSGDSAENSGATISSE